MRNAPRSLQVCCIVVSLAFLMACQKSSAPKEKSTGSAGRKVEPYVATAGAVGFDLLPLASSDGTSRWTATYATANGASTKFRIELGQPTQAEDSAAASGNGKLLREPGSDPLPMLDALRSALHAKSRPGHVEATDELSFDYTIVGETQTRLPDGKFSGNPAGNWMVIKLSVGSRHAEVFLNLDAPDHQGEFSMADPKYGDPVLAEFAKVM